MAEVETLFVTPSGRPRTVWRLLGFVIVVVLVAGFAVTFQRGAVDALGVGSLAAIVEIVGSVTLYALLVLVVVGYAAWVDHRPRTGLGLGGGGFGQSLAVGLALGGAMTTAVFLVESVGGLVRIVDVLAVDSAVTVVPGGTVPAATLAALGPLAIVAMLVPFFVAVGVAEEVLVRGYLLTNVAEGLAGLRPFNERAAVWSAIGLTGGLFGALHFANPSATLRSAAAISAIGVALGWSYAVTGDLGVPIGVHVTWNLTLATVWGYPVSGLSSPASLLSVAVTGDPLVTGGAFGPEAGLVVVVPLVVLVGGTALLVRRRGDSLAVRPSLARPTHAPFDDSAR